MRKHSGELLSVGIVGSVGMLETNSLQSFQHFNAFNDFNALQEGNAVQDSPSLPMVMTKGRLKMKTSNQLAMYRESLVKYALKYGVTKTAIKYNTNRQYVYRWKNRYNGTTKSLLNRSHRPNSFPNAHTESEINLIKSYHRRNKHTGLVMLYVKLVQAGYKRSITSLYRQLRKLNAITVKLPNPKIKPKKYETMFYCGQRVQIDVKVVPTSCIIGIEKYYQYTAIDEYSRKRFLMAFKEQSTYSTYQFVNALQNAWKFKIECIQTDNGSEFTNRFTTNKDKPSLLDLWCEQHNCIHKLIKPMTPRHNGKVERSHRKDNEYFYATHKFYDFEDFKRQLKRWNYQYNNIPTRSLDWKTPQSVYNDYVKFGEVYEFIYNK